MDLETMGSSPNAAIIAIGAVEFDLETRELGRTKSCMVSLKSSVNHGGVMDADTVLWWMKQSDEARKPFSRSGWDIDVALKLFSDWFAECYDKRDLCVWGNGSDFDNVILASAYSRLKMVAPWHYYNNRCYRTVKNLFPLKMERTGIHHNAGDDAVAQARHLLDISEKFNLIGQALLSVRVNITPAFDAIPFPFRA